MRKNLFLFLTFFTLAFILSGCEHEDVNSYFNDDVIVQYHHSLLQSQNDYLIFEFSKTGTYEVIFSLAEGGTRSEKKYLPKNFTIIIHKAPRKSIIKQYCLPGYLKITITKKGDKDVTESHDFQ